MNIDFRVKKMKTYTLKASEIKKDWFVVDAEGLVLGRLAAIIAKIIRGKHKPEFTPNLDCGDNVIIINADKIALTGKKWTDKIYYWHTGYPGGIKSRSMQKLKEGNRPELIIKRAVKRMLSKGPLSRLQLKNLHVYTGAEHPHAAQTPKPLDVGAMNRKNKRMA